MNTPPRAFPNPKFQPRMNPKILSSAFVVILLVLFGLAMAASGTYVINPGTRGVKVTLGKVSPDPLPEGFGLKSPFITTVVPVDVRQSTAPMKADCFSSDLQQIKMQLSVLYRVKSDAVVKIYQQYSTQNIFEQLVAPRVQEGLKEVTATQSAEQIVQNREDIKTKALEIVRRKVGDLIDVNDIVIADITLSEQLEHAIEAKMVQAQEAAKAKFIQQRAEIEALTAAIKAKGEAEAIRIRSEALRGNPELIQLQIVEKWDGRAPLVIGGGSGGTGGANILLPLQDLQNASPPSPSATPARR
jgi:prohibitin 2